MKKKRKRPIVNKAVVFLATVVLIVLIGVLLSNSDSRLKVNVYCLNASKTDLVPNSRYLNYDNNGELMKNLLNMLKESPKNKELVSAVPDFVQILNSKYVNDSVLEVEFSKEYHQMTPTEELLFRSALVCTMTELSFIKAVHIFVEGEELLTSLGNPLGELTRDKVQINPKISPARIESETVTLYFADESLSKLVPEERIIVVNPNEPIEKYLMEQLIAGPKSKNLYPTIPAETKIRNVRSDEGTCYVNLSNDFISKHSGGTIMETLTIYSIVNTLTELSDVKKVQFYIESEKVASFKGNIELDKAFERKEKVFE